MASAFLISLLAGLSTVIGALIILIKIKKEYINKVIVFALSLSSAVMIGISITELIPSSFFNILFNYGVTAGQWIILVCASCGYLFIILLNKYFNNDDSLYKLGIFSMITLMLHNFPEGIATFIATYKDFDLGLKLGFTIMLHNIPEGLAIAVPIYYSTLSKTKAIKYALISGLSEPLGALIAYLFFRDYINFNTLDILMIFIGVMMITLVINKLLPKAFAYNNKSLFILGIFLGFLIVLINFL